MKPPALPKAARRKRPPRRRLTCHCRDCGNYNPEKKNNCETLKKIMDPATCWARMSISDRLAVDQKILTELKLFHSWSSCDQARRELEARKTRWAKAKEG